MIILGVADTVDSAAAVLVDGELVKGNVVPVLGKNETHEIEVILGENGHG